MVPDLRPSSPFSSGPTLFLAPSPIAWQAMHLRNDFSPSATSLSVDPRDRLAAVGRGVGEEGEHGVLSGRLVRPAVRPAERMRHGLSGAIIMSKYRGKGPISW